MKLGVALGEADAVDDGVVVDVADNEADAVELGVTDAVNEAD